jgi:hypothetical protein
LSREPERSADAILDATPTLLAGSRLNEAG